MKKVIAFVPVKLNNERLPGKNTRPFKNGRPLICYILETLRCVSGIDEIYVYCSDEAICEYLPEGVQFLKRDKSLDQNSTLILEVLKAFAKDRPADVYVLTHATAPFLKRESIECGVKKVVEEGYDSALAVTKLNEFLWHEGVPLYDNRSIPRTQDLEDFHAETTGLYVYTHDLLMKEGRRTGDHPYMIETDRYEAVDINDPIDFDIAETIYNKYMI